MHKVIVKYMVLTESTYSNLTYEATRYISHGWQPFGGVSTMAVPNGVMQHGMKAYSQAMVIYEEELENVR